ncbi:hypothetical protein BDZ45DRAFT_687228 [Acephala macrosclerotiorum]|nr:hypothetical protein BDZ45DRAFT_687228 [Acephala macrosclerotiorum]
MQVQASGEAVPEAPLFPTSNNTLSARVGTDFPLIPSLPSLYTSKSLRLVARDKNTERISDGQKGARKSTAHPMHDVQQKSCALAHVRIPVEPKRHRIDAEGLGITLWTEKCGQTLTEGDRHATKMRFATEFEEERKAPGTSTQERLKPPTQRSARDNTSICWRELLNSLKIRQIQCSYQQQAVGDILLQVFGVHKSCSLARLGVASLTTPTTHNLEVIDLIATLATESRPHITYFHRFSDLLSELRIEIWKFALLDKRPGFNTDLFGYFDEVWCLGAEVGWDGNLVYSFEVIKDAVSDLSHDPWEVGISAATQESRSVYLETFSKHTRVKKAVLRYHPGTIIYIEALLAVVRPCLDETSLWISDLPSLRDVPEAWQFFENVNHVACRVHGVYNMTRTQKTAYELASPLY